MSTKVYGTVSNKNTIFSHYFEVTEVELDEVNNRRKIRVDSILYTNNIYHVFDTVGERNFYIKIDDEKVVDENAVISCNPWPSNPYIIQTYTGWINHEDDGSKKVKIDTYINAIAAEYGPGICQASGSINLTTIPRKSKINTFNNFDVDGKLKVDVTKYSSNFNDVLDIKYGNNVVKTINNYSSNVEFEFTQAEKENIYSLMSNVKSATFIAQITTQKNVNGQITNIGTTTSEAIGTIYNASPIFSSDSINYYDINSVTTSVTGDSNKIVQNLSKIRVQVLKLATAQKGASIASYVATINGKSMNIPISNYQGNVDFGGVDSSSNIPLKVTVTDSRGNSTTVSKNIEIYPWKEPYLNISLNRKNNYEDETYLTADAIYSSINNLNSVSIKYRKKKTTDDWENQTLEVGQDLSNKILFLDFPIEETFVGISTDTNDKVTVLETSGGYTIKEYISMSSGTATYIYIYKNDEFYANLFTAEGRSYEGEKPASYQLPSDFGYIVSLNKNLCAYPYMRIDFLKLSDNVQHITTCDKEYSYNFEITVSDKFISIVYDDIVLPKGQFILFIDTVLKSLGVNCFPSEPNTLKVNGVIEQTSLEEYKKNISKFENALDIIKNTDIYSYNLKSEKDNFKKHLGFVIGDNYNTPDEVITNSGDAIDIYSMIAIVWQAIIEINNKLEN